MSVLDDDPEVTSMRIKFERIESFSFEGETMLPHLLTIRSSPLCSLRLDVLHV